ncbi:Eco57I restriction-modification methylase domain-containing protein [Polaribacter sp.]|uniref:Eco57I restriction-modification methylase domain-containing protein n=1 Tax=Polaribacter sp. TaxID=1920175 RepID=UPI003EF4F85C
MALFQISVLKQQIVLQDKELVTKAYKKYVKYFLNPTIQDNIRSSKEEEYQGIFLTELFANMLGYTLKPNADFNLVAEYKNQNNARKADGAILNNDVAVGVIELKGTNTKDLESIRKQAFDYKANQKGCVYVITSNFEKLRFYINDATEFEEFNLFELSPERFSLLYLCLQKDNIINNVPLNIKEASVVIEEQITKQFYKDYSVFKRELYRDLVKRNAKQLKAQASSVTSSAVKRSQEEQQELQRLEKNVKLTLFKKSQKLIDRYLFIFFAEDRGLLPANSTQQILDKWKDDVDFGDDRPLYVLFKQYFNFLDQGRAGTLKRAEIYAYNGGLFKEDKTLDNLEIDSNLLYNHTGKLAGYDFESQVDVNILGHIFENSLNEIESVNAEIEGSDFDKQKSKRKKDGVFYTPKYITKYIVENTIGKLCDQKKTELDFKEEEYFKGRKNRQKATITKLVNILDTYRDWLLQLTICDPACGSGAFLNQALDFLIKEHTYIDELKTKVLGGGLQFPDIENTILENNIYGVDLNEESVEIAKLSLWLRTAQPRRKLNDLSSNIKCGNSLIDSKAVAGDKAFNWETQFPKIFKEKDKKAYHITTAIHDSRTSDRMVKYKVRAHRDLGTNPYPNVIYFTSEDDVLITNTIADIVKEDQLNLLAYNICADHIHLLLVCHINDIPAIMQKIKGRTSFVKGKKDKEHNNGLYKGLKPLAEKEKPNKPLWQQKYSSPIEITTTEQLLNTIKYIQTNRAKHELPAHQKATQQLIDAICCTQAKAFTTEFTGGFDVVIGNPPYVNLERMKEVSIALQKQGYETYNKRGDLYILFVEKAFSLTKETGFCSYIMPNKWLQAGYGENLRAFFLTKELQQLIDFGDIQIFEGATTYPCIFIAKNNKPKKNINVSVLKSTNAFDFETVVNSTKEVFDITDFSKDTWIISSKLEKNLLARLSKNKSLEEFVNGEANYGIKFGLTEAFLIDNYKKQELINDDVNSEKIIGSILRGRDLTRYGQPVKENLDSIILAGFGSYKFIEEKYPAIYNHLIKYEEKLRKRGQCNGSRITEEKPFTGQHHWLELDNNPSESYLSIYKRPKIMYQKFQVKPCFIFDEQQLYCNDSMWIIPTDNKALLGVLNSKMGWFLITKYCTQIQNGCQLIWKYFSKIPIPELNNSNLDLEVNQMLLLNSDFQNIFKKFQTYLQQKFNLEKLSRKLQNWHELEFGEFIKELNKAIKIAIKNYNGLKPIAIAPLTKKDEFEWLDLFEENKQKAQALQIQINQTDKQIDAMVYALYGLTEEEIKIVENS